MTPTTIRGPQGNIAVIRSKGNEAHSLLFLHADPGRAAQWLPVMTGLAESYNVVAFDCRGTGDSDAAADGDYSYEGRVADLEAVVEALGLAKFALVAHSGSTAVALGFSARHPGKVIGIYLLDPPVDPRTIPPNVRQDVISGIEGPKSQEFFMGFVGSIAGTNEATRTQVLADAARVVPAARAGFTKALMGWNPEAALRAFAAPMFILSTPATDTPSALYHIRADILHSVASGNGHWLQIDDPDMVAASIADFLKKLHLEAGSN